MEMTIEELITFCEEREYNHRLSCKRYDDASGFTRSKDKNIRTACAIREEIYINYYKQMADTMRKYQKIEEIIKSWKDGTLEEKDSIYAFHKIIGVVDNGKTD